MPGFLGIEANEPEAGETRGKRAGQISFRCNTRRLIGRRRASHSPELVRLFCGDTGDHEHWAEIRRRYRPVTALLPCDGTALRWEPRQIMNPAEAARAALELGCPQVLQTHADATYTDPVAHYLSSSTEPAPVARLNHALERARRERAHPGAGLPSLTPLAIGETRPLAAAGSTTI
ncbi:MAG: hypothetical protein ABI895_25685 [Deltaproteobacteria bacterium]